MSGGKLTRVRNERSLTRKKSIENKLENDNEEGKGRPKANTMRAEKLPSRKIPKNVEPLYL